MVLTPNRSPQLLPLVLICVPIFSNCAAVPMMVDDMDTAAAEPRPVVMEATKHPVGEQWPLVLEVGGPIAGEASEKIEKVLQKPLAFAYNEEKPSEEAVAVAEAKIPQYYIRGNLLNQKNLYEDHTLVANSKISDRTTSDSNIVPRKAEVPTTESAYEVLRRKANRYQDVVNDQRGYYDNVRDLDNNSYKQQRQGNKEGRVGVIQPNTKDQKSSATIVKYYDRENYDLAQNSQDGESDEESEEKPQEQNASQSEDYSEEAEPPEDSQEVEQPQQKQELVEETSKEEFVEHPQQVNDESKDKAAEESVKEVDTVSSSSHAHHKHKHGGGDKKYEEGGGKKHHADHHAVHGKKGSKGYKGHHDYDKSEKGHHDKEDHKKDYKDQGGYEKKHHEEGGHYGEHHKGQKGEKGSKFDEEGKHSKGHSTKGEHNIHKKDEYEKKHEFYDEHHEGGEHEKHGGFHHESDYKKGGHKKGGHHKGGKEAKHYDKKSHHAEGDHHHEDKGHKEGSGHDVHHDHHDHHAKKGTKKHHKKLAYKKVTGSGGGGGGGKKHGHAHAEDKSQSYQVIKPQESKVVPKEEHKEKIQESQHQEHYEHFPQTISAKPLKLPEKPIPKEYRRPMETHHEYVQSYDHAYPNYNNQARPRKEKKVPQHKQQSQARPRYKKPLEEGAPNNKRAEPQKYHAPAVIEPHLPNSKQNEDPYLYPPYPPYYHIGSNNKDLHFVPQVKHDPEFLKGVNSLGTTPRSILEEEEEEFVTVKHQGTKEQQRSESIGVTTQRLIEDYEEATTVKYDDDEENVKNGSVEEVRTDLPLSSRQIAEVPLSSRQIADVPLSSRQIAYLEPKAFTLNGGVPEVKYDDNWWKQHDKIYGQHQHLHEQQYNQANQATKKKVPCPKPSHKTKVVKEKPQS